MLFNSSSISIMFLNFPMWQSGSKQQRLFCCFFLNKVCLQDYLSFTYIQKAFIHNACSNTHIASTSQLTFPWVYTECKSYQILNLYDSCLHGPNMSKSNCPSLSLEFLWHVLLIQYYIDAKVLHFRVQQSSLIIPSVFDTWPLISCDRVAALY